MKVNTDATDKFGTPCIIFEGVKNIESIYDYLWRTFQGYKFALVLDTSGDEYDADVGIENKVCVYFFGDIFNEVVAYLGTKDAYDQLKRLMGK